MAELLDRKSIQLKKLYEMAEKWQTNKICTKKNTISKTISFKKDVKYRRGITIRGEIPFVPFISVIYVHWYVEFFNVSVGVLCAVH